MAELHEDLRGDTKLQAREKQSSSIQNHFIKVRRMFFERCANEAEERMDS